MDSSGKISKQKGDWNQVGFAIKRNENGDIERSKARLMALGCRPNYGVDYHVTYSPVANMNSIRIFLVVTME